MGTTTAPTGFGRPIWNAIKGGNQVHGVGLTPVTATIALPNSTTGLWNADKASVLYSMFTAPATSSAGGFWKLEHAIVECKVVVVDNSHASNGTELYLVVGRDPVEVRIAAASPAAVAHASKKVSDTFILTNVSGGGATVLAATSAAAPAQITINGPDTHTPAEVFLAAGDMLSVAVVRNGAGHDTSGMGPITITAFLRHSPPGR